VEEIQDFAFDICNGRVHIPNSVTKIGKQAFGDLEERKRILQKAYEEALRDFKSDIKSFCSKRGADFISVSTDMPIERVLFSELLKAGIMA
jgi:hypothetical protein